MMMMKRMEAHPIQKLVKSGACPGMIVREQAARYVGEALLHNGVVGVHPQCDALDDAEGSQDERKVGGDLHMASM
jgi:hypothetical protein